MLDNRGVGRFRGALLRCRLIVRVTENVVLRVAACRMAQLLALALKFDIVGLLLLSTKDINVTVNGVKWVQGKKIRTRTTSI